MMSPFPVHQPACHVPASMSMHDPGPARESAWSCAGQPRPGQHHAEHPAAIAEIASCHPSEPPDPPDSPETPGSPFTKGFLKPRMIKTDSSRPPGGRSTILIGEFSRPQTFRQCAAFGCSGNLSDVSLDSFFLSDMTATPCVLQGETTPSSHGTRNDRAHRNKVQKRSKPASLPCGRIPDSSGSTLPGRAGWRGRQPSS